ncbi:MAG: hypothetical protein ACJ75B_10720 [Flavisolibacter sp.]
MKIITSLRLSLLIFFQVLLISCGNVKKAEPIIGIKDTLPDSEKHVKDTSLLTQPSSLNHQSKIYIVERGRFSNQKYSAYVSTVYFLPEKLSEDSSYYRDGSYFYLVNKTTRQKDSTQLSENPSTVLIEDMSALIKGKAPLFHVSWVGDSDMGMDEFFGFKEDSLQMLFEFNNLIELKRKNDSTLVGWVTGRDELLYQFERYPVTVSLPDYTLIDDVPSNQAIGYTTKVLSNFTGYYISNKGRTPYLFKAGTEILVDSIYRNTKMVRLRTKDSIIIYVPFSKIEGKVQVNAAG